MTNPFAKLRWHRLRVELVRTRGGIRVREHPLAVINSIVKNVCARTGFAFPDKTLFHIRGKGLGFRFQGITPFSLELVFLERENDEIEKWRDDFLQYLANKNRNFSVGFVGQPEERHYASIAAELGWEPIPREICLEFLTPLNFPREPGRHPAYLPKLRFIRMCESRFKRLFEKEFTFQGDPEKFSLLPYYWDYARFNHIPKSGANPENAKQTMPIDGYVGKLYLKGDMAEILPYLILGSEVHMGGQLAYASGYYKLHLKSIPHFSKKLFQPGIWQEGMRKLEESFDFAAETLSGQLTGADATDTFAQSLRDAIKSGTYATQPNEAFLVPKHDGACRLVERPVAEDLLVQKVVLICLQDEFDTIFEEHSHGFRKGRKISEVVAEVQQALRDGYLHVFESDIEDFFPSVNHDRLRGLLAHYLPESDQEVLHLIMKLVQAGNRSSAPQIPELKERTRGLAMGSPLSPMLANLYLDEFDETFLSDQVRMFRYGDDFLILAKNAENLFALAYKAETRLAEFGLNLKETKTRFLHASAGFQFLGRAFTQDGAAPESVETESLRKPLYILEPYAFIAINGDSVEIRKNRTLIQAYPLNRISEIIALEKCSFSTSLVHQSAERRIPVTLLLNTAYHITTITPWRSEDYHLAHQHAQKFYTLSETEKLLLAREIVQAKIHNYQTLFRQRYLPGMAPFLDDLEMILERIEHAAAIDEVRGHEGQAARLVFQNINRIIDNPAFHMKKRDRKIPDPINVTMNLTYSLLFSRLNSLVRASGLNPYLGLVHSHENRYESLTYDLMEPFRARMDRFIIRTINQNSIKEGDFKTEKGKLYFIHEKKKHYLELFERELESDRSKTTLALKQVLHQTVKKVILWVEKGHPFPVYRWEHKK